MTGTSEYNKESSITAKCKDFFDKLQDIPISEGLYSMELIGQHVSHDGHFTVTHNLLNSCVVTHHV